MNNIKIIKDKTINDGEQGVVIYEDTLDVFYDTLKSKVKRVYYRNYYLNGLQKIYDTDNVLREVELFYNGRLIAHAEKKKLTILNLEYHKTIFRILNFVKK